MGPLPNPPTKAMKGLLRKSLISVADAVRTIFFPVTVSNLSLPVVENMIVWRAFKNYYRLNVCLLSFNAVQHGVTCLPLS